MDVKEIKDLGRDGIIKMVVDKIVMSSSTDGETFELENFDRVKVMASDRTVYVTFDMSVRYVPLQSRFCYGLYVNITDMMSSMATIGNPSDFMEDGPAKFFQPTEESRKAIAFVKEAFKREGTDHFEPFTIFDMGDHYDIEMVNEWVEAGVKVDKETGKVSGEYHNHLEPMPDLEDEVREVFEEITD
jgi:hypothetical protein